MNLDPRWEAWLHVMLPDEYPPENPELAEVLSAMTLRERRVMFLRDVCGLTALEASAVLGVHAQTVSKATVRAERKVRVTL